jgi:hypothetical protein
MHTHWEKDFNDNTHNLRKIVDKSNIKSKIDIEDEIDLPSSYSSDNSLKNKTINKVQINSTSKNMNL